MANYILPPGNPSTVVLADNRDVETSLRRHVKNTGRGGVDLVAKVGTPVFAPMDCTVIQRPNNGTAGNSMNMEAANGSGWSDVYSHLSEYSVADGALVKQGDQVGLTGESGAPGQPHLHWHREDPDGVRKNPWHSFENATSFASFRTATIKRTDMDMRLYWIGPITGPTSAIFATANGQTGVENPADYNILKRVIIADPNKAIPDHMLPQEADRVDHYLSKIALGDRVRVDWDLADVDAIRQLELDQGDSELAKLQNMLVATAVEEVKKLAPDVDEAAIAQRLSRALDTAVT